MGGGTKERKIGKAVLWEGELAWEETGFPYAFKYHLGP